MNQIDLAELVTLEEEDLLEMGMLRDDNRALLLSAVRAVSIPTNPLLARPAPAGPTAGRTQRERP